MRALLIRDFRAYKYFFMLLLFIMIIYSSLILKTGSISGLVGFLVVYVPSFAGVVLFLGDNELIDKFASLPVSRDELVLSKYLSTYLFGGVLLLLTLFITWLFSGFYETARIEFLNLISLKGFLFAIMPITLIVSVSYPLLFKFGLKLGVKLVLMSFALLYGIGMVVAERMTKKYLPMEGRGIFASAMAVFKEGEIYFGDIIFYILIISILTVLIVGSIYLSVYWMRRKDLS